MIVTSLPSSHRGSFSHKTRACHGADGVTSQSPSHRGSLSHHALDGILTRQKAWSQSPSHRGSLSHNNQERCSLREPHIRLNPLRIGEVFRTGPRNGPATSSN